jgi:hypothetical protein
MGASRSWSIYPAGVGNRIRRGTIFWLHRSYALPGLNTLILPNVSLGFLSQTDSCLGATTLRRGMGRWPLVCMRWTWS